MASIDFKNVTKTFDHTTVIKDLDLHIEDGSFTVLVGPSGCGKTTLLRMIAGIGPQTSGAVLIDGTDVTEIAPGKRGVAMVFQNYAIYPTMSVKDNIEFGLKNNKVPKAERAQLVADAAEKVGLTDYLDRMPSALSGGQRQRVALARAMVKKPSVFLMDEPLSNLDAKLRESMRFEIKEIQKQLGITVIYVTHDQTEAMAMSDRIFLINRGVVQQSGSPDQIYNHPVNQFVADFLGKVDFIKGIAEEGSILIAGTDQRVRYTGDKRGKVELAVRPENIKFSGENAELHGKIISQYYLGDVNDCRVNVGGQTVRVIADPYTFRELHIGDEVGLHIRDFIAFDDDGTLEEKLQIKT